MIEKTVNSIAEYIDYLKDIPLVHGYWFRGVSSEYFTPKPGLVWQGFTDDEAHLNIDF